MEQKVVGRNIAGRNVDIPPGMVLSPRITTNFLSKRFEGPTFEYELAFLRETGAKTGYKIFNLFLFVLKIALDKLVMVIK